MTWETTALVGSRDRDNAKHCGSWLDHATTSPPGSQLNNVGDGRAGIGEDPGERPGAAEQVPGSYPAGGGGSGARRAAQASLGVPGSVLGGGVTRILSFPANRRGKWPVFRACFDKKS